jgi:hypothetical protein
MKVINQNLLINNISKETPVDRLFPVEFFLKMKSGGVWFPHLAILKEPRVMVDIEQ